ncbi:hypothetical protein ABIE67_003087 [Streptomyces sp. V4I8]|uniref:hypothetical protein n=1 Tax=Streptomyces sp. V4I8 TaxID=3156469 RepID=UPI003518F756
MREDIREDKEGFEVRYTFTVVDTAIDCAPLANASSRSGTATTSASTPASSAATATRRRTTAPSCAAAG